MAGGAWSVNLTAAQAQGLADGSYSIKANVSDAAGNTSTTAALTITLDTIAPTGDADLVASSDSESPAPTTSPT